MTPYDPIEDTIVIAVDADCWACTNTYEFLGRSDGWERTARKTRRILLASNLINTSLESTLNAL